MAFDPSTAEVVDTKAFDPSTAEAVTAFKGRNIPPLKEQAYIEKRSASLGAFAKQQDKDVDYSGVPDVMNRAIYGFLSEQERIPFLKKVYGDENVGSDSFGRPVIVKDGKKISFLPRGEEKHPAASYADIASDVAPVGGMVAGGILGAPGGILGSMGMSGLGAAGGEAINKLIKQSLGLNLQGPGETALDIGKQGATGVLAEGIGQGVRLAGRSMLAPYAERSIFGPNEAAKPAYREQMANVGEAVDMGLTPRVGSYAPAAGLVQRAQNAGFRLFGDPLGLKNRPIIEAGRQELAGKVGAAGEMTPETVARSGEAINPQLAKATDVTLQSAEQKATVAMSDASNLISQAQKRITQDVGQPKGGLAASVDADIRASKDAFRTKSSELYGPVDAMAGKPSVPTQGIKDMMKTIIEEGPQTQAGKPLLASESIKAFAKDISDLPPYVSFQQMQIVRSTLRDKSALDALNAGLSERQAARLATASDGAFDEAGKAFSVKMRSPIVDESGKPITTVAHFPASQAAKTATNSLRRADAFYAAGMKRYNDLNIEALVKDATQTGFIQPERIATYIASPGQVDKLMRIKKVVSPDSFAEVGREKWSQLVNASSDSLTADVSGKKLADRLTQMGGSLDVLYGRPQAQEMRTLAMRLAALDGKIPADSLQGGNITEAIKKALATEQQFKTLASSNYVNMIRSGGPESLRAAEWLTSPQNRLQFRNAVRMFGENSPEANSLKEYLARKIFVSMEVPASAVEQKFGATVLRGEPLQQTLNQYGRPYLEEVFSKEWSDKVHAFANKVEIGTRYNPQDSGGLAAAALGLRWMHHLVDLGKFYSIGWATAKSPVITYMTKGTPGVQDTSALMETLRTIATQGTRGYIGYQAEELPKQIKGYGSGIKQKGQSILQ